jgi:hypothetical protein
VSNVGKKRITLRNLSVIPGASFLFSLGLSNPSTSYSQGATAVELAWGGLGYSHAAADVPKQFPITIAALERIGGVTNIVKELIAVLGKSYLGGKGSVKDVFQALDTGESLIFCVAFDYEQLITTPGVDDDKFEDNESFVYCQAQVLYVDPGADPSTGDFRVLYSFPFRVQYNFRSRQGDNDDRLLKFSKNFIENERSLTKIFSSQVASKAFKEKRFPKSLRVINVTFSPEFNSTLDFLKIRTLFPAEFVANCFSTSLAEEGGLSVIPFRANQLIGETLSKRFKQDSKVFKLVSTMGGTSNLDYSITIEMHRMVRRISGENQANVRIARGMSCFILLTDIQTKNDIAKLKLSYVTDIVIDRISFTKSLQSFDLRYMIQMVISMFDDFVRFSMHDDTSKAETLGLKKGEFEKDLLKFKNVFQSCVYRD